MRSSCKVLLIKDGKILLNRCRWEVSGEIYYDLPGGGQHQFEPLEEAALREVMEETGYKAEIVRFAALAEEIYSDQRLREKYPEYAHRIASIFIAKPIGEAVEEITEMDFQQEGSLWVSLDEADKLPLLPKQLRGRISELVTEDKPMYLGCSYVDES